MRFYVALKLIVKTKKYLRGSLVNDFSENKYLNVWNHCKINKKQEFAYKIYKIGFI